MTAALVQSGTDQKGGTSTLTVTLGATPTVGNLLVVWMWARSAVSGNLPTVSGFTSTPESPLHSGGSNETVTGISYRVVQLGDTATVSANTNSGVSATMHVAEFSGAGALADTDSASTTADTTTSTTVAMGSVTTSTGALIVGAAALGIGDPDTTSSFTPSRGTILASGENFSSQQPGLASWYESTSSGATVAPTITIAHGGICRGRGGLTAAFSTATITGPGVVIDPTGAEADPIPIGDDIIKWTITRGASAEITGGAQPGTCVLVLKNVNNSAGDDAYNPENGSSALIDYLHDGTAVWVGVNSDGKLTGTDPRGLFGGRFTDITPIPAPGATIAPTVEIVAEDALGWYGRVPVQVDYLAGRSQGALRAAILADAGETRTSLDNEITTMPLSAADGNALGTLDDINKANGTRHFAQPADLSTDWYTYVTRNRQWRLDATSDFTLSQLSNHVTGSSGWRLSADTVTNQQRATSTPVKFTPSTFSVWTADILPLLVTTARPFEVWVDFDDYVNAPVVNSSHSGATPTITLTSFGTRAHLTITVASGTCTFTHLSVDGALARRLPTQSWVADDLTSQVLPRGVREGSEISGEYVGILESARGIAEHVVWRYASPQVRPTVVVENWFPYMFDIDLYDIVSYTSPQLGVTSRLFEVVGLTHESDIAADAAQHHVLTLVLQECRVQADPGWFTWDSSVWNGSDVLGY